MAAPPDLRVLALALLAACPAAADSAVPVPVRSAAGGTLDLRGTWAFRPEEAGADAARDPGGAGWTLVQVPGVAPWTQADQVGWYRLDVVIPAAVRRAGALGLTLGKVDSAYELYVDGVLLGGAGRLPPRPALEYDHHLTFLLPAGLAAASETGQRLRLALRVWNSSTTTSQVAGLWDGPLLLGPYEELVRREHLHAAPDLVLVGIAVFVSALHIVLRRRGREREYTWFALSAALAGVYLLLRSQWKYVVFAGADFTTLKRLEHAALYLLMPSFLHLLWTLVERSPPGFVKLYQAFCVAGALLALASPDLAWPLRFLVVFLYSIVAMAPLMAVMLYRQHRQGRGDARVLLAGALVVALAYTNDTLAERGWWTAPRLTPLGMAGFLFAMTHLLGRRFTRALADLEELRARLEERVEERTAALAAANAVLEEQARRLAEAVEVRSRFLANMSHEIRTPLNGVLGSLHLLDRTTLDRGQREHLNTLRLCSRALLDAVNDILDFSRLEAGRLELDRVSFDLPAVVAEAVATQRPAAGAKGLDLTLEVDAALGQVEGDPLRLRQALGNLVNNAVKFTAAGWVRVRVRSAAGELVHFEVADSGPGIEEAAQARIFQPFEQADSSTTRLHGGTGLGLALTRTLAEAMGGDAGFSSRPGEGSTFWFTAHLPPRPAPAGAAAAAPRRGGLVLLAEDNPINRMIEIAFLQSLGFEVDVAADGAEAVAACLNKRYDAVLMDCHMPTMDGYDATREIRLREGGGRRTPIIALTASNLAGDRERCLQAGMDDHLGKPVDPSELGAMLGRWLERSAEAEAAPPRTPAAPDVDPSRIAEFRAHMPPAKVREVVDMFLAEVPLRLAELKAALERADAAAIAEGLHGLKGTSGFLGAVKLHALCAEAEGRARAGLAVEPGLLAELEAGYQRVRDPLRRAAEPPA